MVYERLLHWENISAQQKTKRLPDKIVYYRDGVSSGHYDKIKQVELAAIDRAYAKARTTLKLNPQDVRLTAVIVTKRHHTRFYVLPGQPGDDWGNGNTLPGTSVDKLVTSPYYQDFFLQSHSGIKGTAKPTHYFVLRNDNPTLTLDKIRDLVMTPYHAAYFITLTLSRLTSSVTRTAVPLPACLTSLLHTMRTGCVSELPYT